MADPVRSGTSPAVAAFASGAVSVLLTVAATLVSLRNEADKKQLFEVLNWVMYAAGAATFLVLLWIISTTLQQRIALLRSLRDLEAHVSRHVRMRKRTDRLVVSPGGSGTYTVDLEVEAERDVAVHWIAFPVFSSAKSGAPAWQSASLRRMVVDGRVHDVRQSYDRRRRSTVEGQQYTGLVFEEWVVHVPVPLEVGKSKCRVTLEIAFNESMPALFTEESHMIDISYLTDEVDVHLIGEESLELYPSPLARYLVEASQNRDEQVDGEESILQSSTCRHGNGVHWRSKNTKLGYRYEIKFVGWQPVSAKS
ncbi:hypothetical protein LFM09_35080 [Lentzea alba]|uniref:hypothetical protein n=1 Tax=Lentzea alba TaxID=2714351 RepID=UPI0039BF6E7E